MSNNDYIWRPWHLPEDCHVTNWTAREMCRVIKRRDQGRPAFWNMSFTHPHPPLVPLESYLARYAPADMPDPAIAEWARDPEVSVAKYKESDCRPSLNPATSSPFLDRH